MASKSKERSNMRTCFWMVDCEPSNWENMKILMTNKRTCLRHVSSEKVLYFLKLYNLFTKSDMFLKKCRHALPQQIGCRYKNAKQKRSAKMSKHVLLFLLCAAKQKKLSKKCLLACKAQQKMKKLSKKCLFDCKAQQKRKQL